LKEIRQDALIIPVVHASGQRIFLSVCKGNDEFHLITGKADGAWATSVSEAAEHLYAAFGKEWRKSTALRPEARRKARALDRAHTKASKDRDKPWPCCMPDLEGLKFLHEHTLHGDRWIDPVAAAQKRT